MKRKLSQLIMALIASMSINMANAATHKIHKKSYQKNSHQKKSSQKSSGQSHQKKIHQKNSQQSHHKKAHKHGELAGKNFMHGTASFYGENDGFAGRKMADGNLLNPNDAHFAAHPTLPLGTKLMVTNLSNNRTIYVEVTDRMPKKGRVIDLTFAAAKYLGMHNKGLAKVELVRISEDEFARKKRYLEVDNDDSGAQG
ncbi:MAG: hypothetical protein K0R49_204 [Burkholderiales bacterium]|jgi:rare lipoprotein A (peptidoglycan hydrolase)|nr:hypothetical protein [Burkholderiales bacterium]MCE3267952.1 hypothetical protein [Burkholderiales bacterium]